MDYFTLNLEHIADTLRAIDFGTGKEGVVPRVYFPLEIGFPPAEPTWKQIQRHPDNSETHIANF